MISATYSAALAFQEPDQHIVGQDGAVFLACASGDTSRRRMLHSQSHKVSTLTTAAAEPNTRSVLKTALVRSGENYRARGHVEKSKMSCKLPDFDLLAVRLSKDACAIDISEPGFVYEIVITYIHILVM